MKIGVFDSGIGGLNVLKEIMKQYPNSEYIYFGDTFYLPYGEKTREELIKLGMRIIHFFEKENVDKIVIACGTCSSLVEEYQKQTKIPIIDVITPTVEYAAKHYNSVALLATKATIQNQVFENKLKEHNITVYPLACPNFVPFIEGMSSDLDIQKELSSLSEHSFESIILGCTHYPLLKNEIKKIVNVPTIDMGIILSQNLDLESSNQALTIYMSKVTPMLEEKVFSILGQKVFIKNKNLPV